MGRRIRRLAIRIDNAFEWLMYRSPVPWLLECVVGGLATDGGIHMVGGTTPGTDVIMQEPVMAFSCICLYISVRWAYSGFRNRKKP
jgi:hypothetical protein